MTTHRIEPEKVTRPLQLLAAWLTGLIIINGTFLLTATNINSPSWASNALVIAAIINVPMFLVSIFLLQTRFRPEMQEDIFYSKYLERKYTTETIPQKPPDIEADVQKLAENIAVKIGEDDPKKEESIKELLIDSQIEQLSARVGGSRTLSEIYLRPELWIEVVDRWGENTSFIEDVKRLRSDGLIVLQNGDTYTAELTDLGLRVAKEAEKEGILFQQTKTKYWDQQGRRLSKEKGS